jgi:hypothetical protein
MGGLATDPGMYQWKTNFCAAGVFLGQLVPACVAGARCFIATVGQKLRKSRRTAPQSGLRSRDPVGNPRSCQTLAEVASKM